MLHMACFAGRLEVSARETCGGCLGGTERCTGQVAKHLVDAGANVNATEENGRTPLHAVAYGNHVDIARLLVLKGAKVNAVDSTASSALHWAAKQGSAEMVQLLLDRGANLNLQTKEGWTATHLACTGSHADVAMLLVSRGANITLKDRQGASPVRAAVNTGHIPLVKFFLDRNTDAINTKVRESALIDLACARKFYDMMDVLVSYGATVTERVHKAALREQNIRLLRMCVEHKLETTQQGLYLACKKGDLSIVKTLVEKRGFPVDASCVRLAHESRDVKVIHYVRDKATAEWKCCSQCGAEEGEDTKLMRCSKCKLARYCSTECQRKHYPDHKSNCVAYNPEVKKKKAPAKAEE